MCGIAGLLNYNLPLNNLDVLKNMLSQIEYRGPDESGIYIGEHIGLGNVRLSIIDLIHGKQPMSTPDEDLWIILNGEIFNYIELRKELKESGYQFRTNSDTEVLLLLFKEYGENCLARLNGQFAFAIWNKNNKELFLARDRVGIRPLFYSSINGNFIFSSEIKSLFKFLELKPEINYQALSQVFTFWTTLSPNTVFKNIYELPPGCYMKVNPSGQQIKRYWQLKFPSRNQNHELDDLNRAMEEFESLLSDAVRIRLRADVPVAAYLSGGIDSSATTYFIKKAAPDMLTTYSIGFSDAEFDETPYQKEVSSWLGTSHIAFKCYNEDIAINYPQVIWHSEIPLLRTGPVPMYLLSKNVHQNKIKVVITGEGADEMLAGYNIFKEAIIREFWSKQPDSKYRPLLLQKLYPYLSQFQGRNKKILKFFFGYKLQETNSPFYSHFIRWNNAEHLKAYFSKDFKNNIADKDPLDYLFSQLPVGFESWDLLSRAQWLESSIFMSGYLLSSQGDRVSMANSVEGRYPFLDYRVIEYCANLPGNFKLNGLTEKYILKKLMRDRLPEKIINRPKQAYRAPIARSFLKTNAPDYIQDYLSTNKIMDFQIFNVDLVHKLIERMNLNHTISEIDNMALAGILSTQMWIDYFINKKTPFKTNRLKSDCRIIFDRALINY